MELPLGDGTIDVSLPGCDVTVAEPPGGEPVDPREAGAAALASPNGPPLSDRAGPGDDVALVVTDPTRTTPDDVLVDLLLAELAAAGVDRDDVTIVVGLGLHRPLSDPELDDLLGEHADLAINHDPDAAVEVGRLSPRPREDEQAGQGHGEWGRAGQGPDEDGRAGQGPHEDGRAGQGPGDGGAAGRVPVEVHPAVARADLVVSTGMVEPHQYAGFSGGAKTVVVGAGGEPLIRYTHGPDLLGRDGVRLGRVRDNPFRSFVDRAGDLAGPDFCLNVTHGPRGVLDAAAGNHRAVVRDLAASARRALSVPVDGEYDAVVAGVGAPKDANLYQASRAATYVALGDRDPLRAGGRIVVPAELPEGAGKGTGERRFYERLAGAADAATLYEEMKAGYEPGAQRAFVVARVLREHDVYVTNSRHPEVVEECLMVARESVAEAVEPGRDVLVVPDATNALLVRGEAPSRRPRYL